MQQVVITRHGGPEVLHVRETAEPQLKSGDVLIDVKYSGINFADLLMRMGLYPSAPKPPFTPGYEVSGVIAKVGSTENDELLGKSVAALTKFGGYSSKVVVKKDRLIALSDGVDMALAAAMPVVYLTSYVMLSLQAHLQKDEWVLIHNIGGGVGQKGDAVGEHGKYQGTHYASQSYSKCSSGLEASLTLLLIPPNGMDRKIDTQ